MHHLTTHANGVVILAPQRIILVSCDPIFLTYLIGPPCITFAVTIFSLSIFSKCLKLDDSLIGIISGSSKALSSLVYAFAPNTTIFYLGTIMESFSGTSYIAVKSLISKLVEPEELGKVYSLFGVCEALMPLVYGPTYTMLYKATINTLPGAFFLAGGLISLPSTLMFWWLYTEHKKDANQVKEMVPLREKCPNTEDNITISPA
ncbi:uncharacterized protein LOC116159026 [Photinus pyralis]|uniref:uncharacterized protein LOC116159026 n=1 Tax=Photinus pyralis TaxID=7054 RepID=UPI0012671E05|nr:uncharacterized protein LOC116159026 [Photinus pyralis]